MRLIIASRASLLMSLISVGLPLIDTGFGIHGYARAHRRTLTTKVKTVAEITFVTVTVEEGNTEEFVGGVSSSCEYSRVRPNSWADWQPSTST
jgi:hypothetical protein